jgi:hypothetical protein
MQFKAKSTETKRLHDSPFSKGDVSEIEIGIMQPYSGRSSSPTKAKKCIIIMCNCSSYHNKQTQ